MYFVAFESIIQLQTHLECALYCVAKINLSLSFEFLAFSLSLSFVLYQKCANVALFATIDVHPYSLPRRWIAHIVLTQQHYRIFTLGLNFLTLRHVVHQTCRCVFLHRHHVQGGDRVFIWHQQTLEQNHDDVFLLHGYLQTHNLIRKCFDLADVVQQAGALLHLICEEFVTNKNDVGQTRHMEHSQIYL